jgi:hypothetical protein
VNPPYPRCEGPAELVPHIRALVPLSEDEIWRGYREAKSDIPDQWLYSAFPFSIEDRDWQEKNRFYSSTSNPYILHYALHWWNDEWNWQYRSGLERLDCEKRSIQAVLNRLAVFDLRMESEGRPVDPGVVSLQVRQRKQIAAVRAALDADIADIEIERQKLEQAYEPLFRLVESVLFEIRIRDTGMVVQRAPRAAEDAETNYEVRVPQRERVVADAKWAARALGDAIRKTDDAEKRRQTLEEGMKSWT